MSHKKEFPFEISKTDEILAENYPSLKDFCVFVGPKKFCFPSSYKTFASKIYNFEARPDDVWVLGFPRSGTTVTSAIIWLLSNELDYKKAAEKVLSLRFPLLEGTAFFHDDYAKLKSQIPTYSGKLAEIAKELTTPAWDSLEATTERRFIKSHLPLSLAPSNLLTSDCKVVYVARNPKDVCVSYHLLRKSFASMSINEDFDTFWNYFQQGLVVCTPYFEHVKEGWKERNHKNVMFLFYEDYLKDKKGTIKNMARFLEREISDAELDTLLDYVNIENFRKDESVNNEHLIKLGILKNIKDNFIRKGVVAKGGEYFEGSRSYEYDIWINSNLKETDLRFPS